ncbi:hypothetical protein MNBD_GAMMA20-1303 [hydrothermal vent metagenome]|uniref:Uncharacterized protein n=1 Tax=hydrothermal vent metagenome TaxID=652676 RepID=A0A3B1AXL8_9ZZZZ
MPALLTHSNFRAFGAPRAQKGLLCGKSGHNKRLCIDASDTSTFTA